MEPRDFDKLVERYAQSPVPSLPESFASDVLRELRLRGDRSAPRAGWFSEIHSVLFHPGVLAACFAIAMTVGVVLPAGMRTSHKAATSQSLGLHVFTSATMNLPSGLLAKVP